MNKNFNGNYSKTTETKGAELKLLRPKDLQEKLGIGKERAYALMRTGGFPSIRLGCSYVVTEAALEDWLKQSEGRTINL